MGKNACNIARRVDIVTMKSREGLCSISIYDSLPKMDFGTFHYSNALQTIHFRQATFITRNRGQTNNGRKYKSDLDFTIRIGGEGGDGVISCGELFAQAAARTEFHIFTYVYVMSPCVTFPILTARELRSLFEPLPADFNPKDNKLKAMELAYAKSPMYTGIFYKTAKPTLEYQLAAEKEKACRKNSGKEFSLKQILNSFA